MKDEKQSLFQWLEELSPKVAKLGCRVYEVPISYHGRDYAEGKKIGFRDALWAVWCIIRYGVAD